MAGVHTVHLEGVFANKNFVNYAPLQFSRFCSTLKSSETYGCLFSLPH